MKEIINCLKNNVLIQENDNPVISQAIKKARLNKNLTLKETCEGICSISYLSKTENNNLSTYSNKYVRRICETVGLDFENLINYNDHVDLNELAYLYLKGDFETIEKMSLSCDCEFYSVKVDLVKGFYCLYLKDMNQVLQVINNIHQMKESLNSDEAFMFIILNILYNIKSHKATKSLEYIKDIEQLESKSVYINYLLQKTFSDLFFEVSDIYKFVTYYNKINSFTDLEFPIEHILISKLRLNILEAKCYNKEIKIPVNFLDSDLDNKSDYFHNEILYYKLMLLIFEKKYEDVVGYLGDKLSVELYAFKLYSMYKLNLKLNVKYDVRLSYHNIFINAIMKLQEFKERQSTPKMQTESFKEYFEDSKYYTHILYNKIIDEEYFNIVTKTQSYKSISNYLIEKIKN